VGFAGAHGTGYTRLCTDWQKLTTEEKELYFKAVNKPRETGQYAMFVRIHGPGLVQQGICIGHLRLPAMAQEVSV
jgi:hypothetical protein